MSWIDHTLPSGQLAQERLKDDGAVVFDLVGTDATIDALDAIELGRIAEQSLRELSLGARCSKCGKFLSAIRREMRIDRCAACDKPRGRQG